MKPRPRHLCIFLLAVMGLGIAPSITAAAPEEASIASLRLEDALARATQVFQSGNYTQATALFDSLEETFGREPEYQKASVQQVILPAWGYSNFVTQNYSEAIRHFETFLDEFPERNAVHAFVLYTLGRAEQFAGDNAAAASRLEEFSATYPQAQEASLATLQQADLLFRMGRTDEALALSETLSSSDASETLRTQARLRVLQEFVKTENFEAAADLLFSTQWKVDKMPELAVLAFAALRIGDAMMLAENFHTALRCYRLVPPHFVLLERQRKEVERAHQILRFRQRTASSAMASAWVSYYAGLVARLESQLEALETMEDYTPGYLLRYGQAFISDGRGREALLLFRDLANDESLPSEMRQQAHYRWILAEFFLQDWEETLAVAIAFEEQYPESELAPESLYLVAQAYQEQGKYRQAIEVYNELLDRFPEHPLAPRWLFTRGFNLSMLEQYDESRVDFARFGELHPTHPLATKARLWHGLTHHFEGNYEEALVELVPLAEESEDHYLYPEIRYRITTARYALQDYDTARQEIESFLEEFPLHQRAPEATVLRGDILMGQGELIPASTAFAQVAPDAGGLFPYAIFQRAKIFKALERYDLMIEHFTDYLDRDDLTARPRMSEALYWLGWAHLQQGNPQEALARFDQALDEFGNDPSATEIQALIASFESLRNDLLRENPDDLPSHPVLQAEDFSAWMDREIDEALANERLTWFSRLKYFQANRERVRGDEQMAKTILQEIDQEVPMEQLDPQVVGQIGLIYAEAGFDYASDYFDFILKQYPSNPARAEAWYGLSQELLAEGDLDEADDLLRKFEQQFPLHPLAPQVRILRGRLLMQLGYYDDAEQTFEEILKLKSARGRPHAQALAGLAELNEAQENRERAVAYWQRIYTLYRAYPDLVAEAYYRSALLFEELGDPGSAFRSLEEMLAEESLLSTPDAVQATDLRRALLETHGPFTSEPDAAEDPAEPAQPSMAETQ